MSADHSSWNLHWCPVFFHLRSFNAGTIYFPFAIRSEPWNQSPSRDVRWHFHTCLYTSAVVVHGWRPLAVTDSLTLLLESRSFQEMCRICLSHMWCDVSRFFFSFQWLSLMTTFKHRLYTGVKIHATEWIFSFIDSVSNLTYNSDVVC